MLAAILVVVTNRPDFVGWILFIGLPAGYVAFLFVSYLLYSQLYQWGTRTFGGPVEAVVVLGSGLGGGERVTPLLAGRLERGRAVFDRSVAAGRSPILVVSGGKGSDERLSEAEAMQGWLLERGFPTDSVVREDRSTDTEENLVYSAEVMRQWGADGEVAVATSNYHSFRAAVIMRKAGIPGYTVGCRTARYYWPSATIREFIAMLLEHARLNTVLVGLLCVPLLFLLVQSVAGLF
ncbi:YdcF family protein [Tessaracoccus coleopterorum]|uniref:YdcF family protein n=1 Tax=Tessaracoccus coleopterorum TaxID=2714950 RepID=UPI002F91930E